jgi:hypothetical protein
MIDYEKLIKLVEGNVIINSEYFNRNIHFQRNGIDYYIEWYKNVGYLSIVSQDENQIPFDNVFVNDTWPRFMGGLQFTYNGKTSTILN